jgi:hypothetical protein
LIDFVFALATIVHGRKWETAPRREKNLRKRQVGIHPAS